jgi:Na+-translocating ferredoxin:NAD+ oxidoreductase RnfG subunit
MSNVISCARVCTTGSPLFHAANAAVAKRHLSALTVVSGFGGSAVCAAVTTTAAIAMSVAATIDRKAFAIHISGPSDIILAPKEAALKRLGVVLALLVGSATLIIAGGQSSADAQQQARLKQLFPAATAFSPKEGEPPHFKAYAGGRGAQTLLGYAFWTTELLPLERGYGGPIVMLVGLDTKGLLTGILITEHHEPYGDFSIDLPGFAATFRGKDVRDPFKLGEDIDAVSRATITMSSAVRAVRNSARRMARQFLTPPAAK